MKKTPATIMFKRIRTAFIAAAGFGLLFSASQAAAGSPDILVENEQVSMPAPPKIEEDRTLVPVRFISEALGADVRWDASNDKVTVHTIHGDELNLHIDEPEVSINGAAYGLDVPPQIDADMDRTYLPLRHVAELAHSEVVWDGSTVHLEAKELHEVQQGESLRAIASTVGEDVSDLKTLNQLDSEVISPGTQIRTVVPRAVAEDLTYEPAPSAEETTSVEQAPEPQVDAAEQDLLARLIHQEAQGEPFDGKVAVGNVIMNRVDAGQYPNSVSGVVHQSGQFTPAMTGAINQPASQRSQEAAREALTGAAPAGNALYFHNPNVTRTSFFMNKPTVTQIGNHRFAR
ncbi:LysM domain-containing protein [Salsuginibacillus halophilus]|uniref:LysM domain-containing protein n=1 Tax=Salsuginibacillus halophilus TaxID=517424 RepID=A0A2P8HQH3_9BACI|nr:stalk domain-containing protein [Salsuginibacillus halophilus]PSL48458.1 LysM domain-containing protein [Salsuginibacillus halophilus]